MKNKLNFIKHINWIWIMIWLMILIVLYYFITNTIHNKTTVPQVCNDDVCFTVELATTPVEREKWLMYREYLAENSWMLFVFPVADIHNFWMKNTIIPLDMIRINDQFKVVRVLTAQPCITNPCTIYKPEISTNYVLEVNAGIAKVYWIQEWTTLELKNIR